MGATEAEREIRRQQAVPDKPLENIKPKRGLLVALEDEQGTWQVMDKSPQGPAEWWLLPWDDEAKAAAPHPSHGRYRSASYRTMRKR